MNNTPDSRRRSLLASIALADVGTATLGYLVREMDMVHNLPVSRDLVHAEMIWLHEMGLIRYGVDNLAQITERGRDVVRQAAPWPGGR